MTEKFTDSSASRIITALETRAERKLKNGAQTQMTWGTVGAVDAGNKTASAYIYGETDGAYMSEGFRIPETMYLTVGQKVRVAMNYATGERWVEEVQVPVTAYKKVAFDLSEGSIRLGSGAAAPDVKFSRGNVGELYLTNNDGNSIFRIWGDSASAASYSALAVNREGDTTARMTAGYDGGEQKTGLFLGDGASGRDVNLYRSAANTLKTDDALVVGGAFTVDDVGGPAGYSLRAGHQVMGGGNITFDASNYFGWTTRFIVISTGNGSTTATAGYFDITQPTSGTITGVGGAANKTATSAGVPLALWEALYYILPLGSGSTSVAANFRVAYYNAALVVPNNWVLLAVHNGDATSGLWVPSRGEYLPPSTTSLKITAGTAFPTSVQTNTRFYRTDLDMEFFYDGARWLSTQLFTNSNNMPTHSATFSVSIAATQANVHRISMDDATGTDIWIVRATATVYINSGTALSASHKWVATVNKLTVGNTPTSIGTMAIDSGASLNWRRVSVTIGALLGTLATYPTIGVDWAMTGTPGSLVFAGAGARIDWRIVQT